MTIAQLDRSLDESISGIIKIYEMVAYLEIRHSENYLVMYQTAKKLGQEKIAQQAENCIVGSIQVLYNLSRIEIMSKINLTLDEFDFG